MAENTPPITGGCRCGAVRYEVTGKPRNVAYCHCTDCRGYSGAPAMVWVAFKSEQVQFLRERPKTYESSPGVEWGFCSVCGTSLIWEASLAKFGGEDVKITEFTISSLDRPEDFIPDQHWYDGERIPWFDVADDLPRFHKLRFEGAQPTRRGPLVGA